MGAGGVVTEHHVIEAAAARAMHSASDPSGEELVTTYLASKDLHAPSREYYREWHRLCSRAIELANR